MSINLGTAKEMAEKAFECADTLMTSDSYEKEVYKTITPVTADNNIGIKKHYKEIPGSRGIKRCFD